MTLNDFCEFYDAFYNKKREWISIRCTDPECYFCNNRPRKHSKHCKCLKEKDDESM